MMFAETASLRFFQRANSNRVYCHAIAWSITVLLVLLYVSALRKILANKVNMKKVPVLGMTINFRLYDGFNLKTYLLMRW